MLTNEDDEEEAFQLTEETEGTDTLAEVTNLLEPDPLFTRIARSICRSCLTAIDSCLSPKTTAIILLIVCVVNTSALALLMVYLFRPGQLVHIILVALCMIIDVIVKFLFCLLRPKKHSKTLLFTCPGIPLVPLVNINIFIFLMVFQDAHDWFAYVVILLFSLLIYFAYSYRHSKSRWIVVFNVIKKRGRRRWTLIQDLRVKYWSNECDRWCRRSWTDRKTSPDIALRSRRAFRRTFFWPDVFYRLVIHIDAIHLQKIDCWKLIWWKASY